MTTTKADSVAFDLANASSGVSSTPIERSRVEKMPWLLAVVFVLVVFLHCNRNIVTGRAAPTWDASSYYAPEFTLVADYARAGPTVVVGSMDKWSARQRGSASGCGIAPYDFDRNC
jgi:hypothetical protein